MQFREVEIPTFRNDYDDIFDALLKAWENGRAVEIITDTHPQSIRVALTRRLQQNEPTRHLYLTVTVTEDGCTVYIEKGDATRQTWRTPANQPDAAGDAT